MSVKKKRLSIVILAYNEEAYLGNCLNSIASQTVMPDEVIVVDNNSTDGTVEVANGFPFVRVIHEKAQGMMFARNRGFDEAKGEFIARIDSDSWLTPGWVEAVHRAMDVYAGKIAAISGPAYFYDLPGKHTQKIVGDLILNIGYFKFSKLMLGHNTLYGSNMVITKEAWSKVREEVCSQSDDLLEDMDLALHIAQYGKVLFDSVMNVGIAKRSLNEPIRKTMWRLRIWPNTVTTHRRLFAQYSLKKSLLRS